jgi:hypothetical protein
VHDEREVRLGFRGEHSGGRKARVVDQKRVVLAGPFYRVGRIRDDRFEGLVVPMERVGQRVAVADVEFVVADIVQEHIDAAEVVGGEVDFLPEKAQPHVPLAQYLGEFEEQGAGAAGGVYLRAVFDTMQISGSCTIAGWQSSRNRLK